MSLEEAHHHRRPSIKAWRKKKMNEVAGFATDGDDDGESCNEDEDNKG